MRNKLIQYIPTWIYLNLRWWDFKLNRRVHFDNIQALRKRETSEWSSYKPFDDTKSIFVHIPKCAGIAVNKALFGNLAGGHTSLDEYINVFEPKLFSTYFKFTFVRNPWDRVVSAYTFLEKGGFNKWDKEFYDKELSGYRDFHDFVCNWLCTENINKHHHFKSQHTYILDKFERVSVDFIGYFENIEEDFATIAKRMGVEAKLEKRNSVSRSNYRSYYDEKTIAIVNEVYKKDIELFNYDFNGPKTMVRSLEL
jgi:hypothetical protein